MSIRYLNGKGVHLDGEHFGVLPTSQVYTISKCGNSLWLGTRNHGILHLQGDIHNLKSLKVKQYDILHDTKLKISTVKKIITDMNGIVWACSSDAGLLMYDTKIDAFVNANKMFGLPDDEICSIELSNNGEILVSMRNNIAIITIDAQSKLKHMRFLTRYDMFGENSFAGALSSVSPEGNVCFGGYDGVLVMNEPQQKVASTKGHPYVTDIKIFGRSMDIRDFSDSASVLLPPYSKEIILSNDQRDITIEFSTLDFDNSTGVRFMYKLEGYDSDWRYSDVDAHEVSYNNLSSGKYIFHLRATDNNGLWGPETTMIIKVQYPWFLRWYSWIVYALLAAFMLYIVFRYFKNKELTRREVQLAHLEKQNIEELNHKKLQFFANLKDINLSSDDEHFVSSCIECVQQHIGNSDFDLDAFAAAMNISKSSLYKKLNSATSLSPSAFVRNIRMKYAAELLSANPKARIADVAYAVGYNDPKYFSNCFK